MSRCRRRHWRRTTHGRQRKDRKVSFSRQLVRNSPHSHARRGDSDRGASRQPQASEFENERPSYWRTMQARTNGRMTPRGTSRRGRSTVGLCARGRRTKPPHRRAACGWAHRCCPCSCQYQQTIYFCARTLGYIDIGTRTSKCCTFRARTQAHRHTGWYARRQLFTTLL